MTVGETQEGRTDRGERKKERESARKGERAGRVNEEESEKERRSQAGDYRPRRRLVYGSADAHHLLKKTCCSKCVHFACAQASLHRPVGATKSPIVSHSTFTFGLGRERERERERSHRSFFDKRRPPRGMTVSQRRLTCRRGYSETTNFISSEPHAPQLCGCRGCSRGCLLKNVPPLLTCVMRP